MIERSIANRLSLAILLLYSVLVPVYAYFSGIPAVMIFAGASVVGLSVYWLHLTYLRSMGLLSAILAGLFFWMFTWAVGLSLIL